MSEEKETPQPLLLGLNCILCNGRRYVIRPRQADQMHTCSNEDCTLSINLFTTEEWKKLCQYEDYKKMEEMLDIAWGALEEAGYTGFSERLKEYMEGK